MMVVLFPCKPKHNDLDSFSSWRNWGWVNGMISLILLCVGSRTSCVVNSGLHPVCGWCWYTQGIVLNSFCNNGSLMSCADGHEVMKWVISSSGQVLFVVWLKAALFAWRVYAPAIILALTIGLLTSLESLVVVSQTRWGLPAVKVVLRCANEDLVSASSSILLFQQNYSFPYHSLPLLWGEIPGYYFQQGR